MRTRVHLHTITHVHTRARTRAQTRAHEQTHVHTRLARTAAPALRCRAISCAPSRARAATWAGHGGGRGRGHAGGGCGSEARERCGGLSGRRRAVAERPATPRDAGASVSLGHVLRSSAACCVPAHHNGAALRTDRKPHSLTTLTKARLRPTAAKPAGYAAPAAFNGQPTAYRAAVGRPLRPLTNRCAKPPLPNNGTALGCALACLANEAWQEDVAEALALLAAARVACTAPPRPGADAPAAEPGFGADVATSGPSPDADVAGVSPVPAQMWPG
jgi:hypothetical protein